MIEEEWTLERVRLKVTQIKAELNANPPSPDMRMTSFVAAVGCLPAAWQGLALECFNSGFEYGADMRTGEREKFIRQSILCGVGIVLILFGVGLTFIHQTLSPAQGMSCCAVIALGSAAFLVFLPGFLVLKGALAPNTQFQSLEFQGGGAAAIFVLVFCLLHFALKI